jgi:tRNA-intron endonuclease
MLSGKLIEDVVVTERQGIEELYNKSFYGRPKGEALEISLTEAAYLIYVNKITVEYNGSQLDFKEFFLKASSSVQNFELLYIVYKDLRERGYYVQPSVTGFRVYPRGGRPGKTPAEYFVYVISERTPLLLTELKKNLDTVDNLKKRLVLAIVDEDSDITYYDVKKTTPSGSYKHDWKKPLATASLLEDRVMMWEPEASALLHNEGFFGKYISEGHLQLSLVESGYLLNKGILNIEKQGTGNLDFNAFAGLASGIESDFMTKSRAYEALRDNGIVPKTGFKFGAHFRVYKNFETISTISHSDYLVHAIEHDHIFSLQQLSRAVRLANSVRKEMIYAAVESQVYFIVVGRIRL